MSAPQPLTVPDIGRFRVLRQLGCGAEGVVWLAIDPKLGREVAVKTLALDASRDPARAEQLLNAARTAGTLAHPNIVPVFEAGMHGACPYVVFEYVEGRTLASQLAADGPMPMGQVVIMMSQILAGVVQMHERQLIHGDLKPANILVDTKGIPRISDFGLARHECSAGSETSGTVRYMAPECFAGGATDCRVDVFALGLIFHEMLSGVPVFGRGNVHSLIYRIGNEMTPAPSASNPSIAPEIDTIVLKALCKNPAERYANAGEMKRELDRFRVPASSSVRTELREQNVHGTVEFLLRRMAHKSDFPALSTSFNRINQLSSQADDASIKALSDFVIRDFALTQKLLRLVNSAAVGGRNVTRISDAITILGVGQLRSISTGIMLAGSGGGKKSPAIEAALTDAFVAGVISRNVGRLSGLATVEELFICGMFSPLGELLALYYLAEEHAEIQRRVTEEGAEPEAAARSVLGLSFDELAADVARHWQFPPMIIAALAPLPGGQIAPTAAAADRMWHCAAYAREMCKLARHTNAEARERAMDAHIERYAKSIRIDRAKLRELLRHTVDVAGKYIAAAGISISNTTLLEGMGGLCAAPATRVETAPQAPGQIGPSPAAVPRIPAVPAVSANATSPNPGWRARLSLALQSMF